MRQHEQALLFVRKAAEDEALPAEVVDRDRISNEIFGFHAQQASEKLLKALLWPRRLVVDAVGHHDLVLAAILRPNQLHPMQPRQRAVRLSAK